MPFTRSGYLSSPLDSSVVRDFWDIVAGLWRATNVERVRGVMSDEVADLEHRTKNADAFGH